MTAALPLRSSFDSAQDDGETEGVVTCISRNTIEFVLL